MKKLKKFAILIIVALVVLSIISCGGGKSKSEEKPTSEETEVSTSQETDTNVEEEKSDTEDRDETEVSPDFKATMDKYEEFFDEYVDFMKKYNENPTDATLLAESADMLTKEAEMMKEMEAMDESEMTTAEAAYYLEVTARIQEKLATVMQ